MVSNSTTEYKIIADKIVSPDEDIIVEIVGGIYKGSITEDNRYTTAVELAAVGNTNLLSVATNIVPATDNVRSLGTEEKRWSSIHIGPGTLYITDQTLGTATALTVDNGVLQIDGANQLQVGQLKFVDNTIESTTGDIDIEIGATSATADLVLNRNTVIDTDKNLTVGIIKPPTGQNLQLTSSDGYNQVYVNNTAVHIQTEDSEGNDSLWKFGDTGFVFPDNTVQTTAPGATPVSFNPQFTDASGLVAGFTATGTYTRVGKLCFFRVFVDFNGYTNLGTGQYQITLPFASASTTTSRDGTLHNVATDAIYHIAGIVETATSNTVMKFYYSGSTTDLAWKYNTPVSWANNQTHFDISGIYEVV
jgi:hypothetical protein